MMFNLNKRITLHSGQRMTVKNYLKLLKATLRGAPEAYNQHAVNCERKPSCNSPACVAGWMAIQLFGNPKAPYEKCTEVVFGAFAWPWLYNACFYGGPPKIQNMWEIAETAEQKADVACWAIDEFVKQLQQFKEEA